MLIRDTERSHEILNEWAKACNEAGPDDWARDILARMNPDGVGVMLYDSLQRALTMETGVYA